MDVASDLKETAETVSSYDLCCDLACHSYTSLANKHTVLLHHFQEFDNNFRGRSDQDLSFTCLFGVDDVVEAVIEY